VGFPPSLITSPSGQSERAEKLAAEIGERLELVLTRLGLIGERDLVEALAAYLNLPLAAAKGFPAAPVLEAKLSRRFLKESRVIPLAARPDGLAVAMADPFDEGAVESLLFAAGLAVARHVATPSDRNSGDTILN
jgi:general secretion pathway protein E